MDIRPVDVQMFINKSAQINKNENQEQKGNEQFQLFSDHFQKTTQEQQNKTIETNKSEDSQINKDGKNKGQNKNKEKNNSKSKEKDKKNNSGVKLSLFDISI